MPSPQAPHSSRRALHWRWVLRTGAGVLLLVPWVAMQFTDQVRWTLSDFVVFGAMLAAACATYELGARLSGQWTYRAGVGLAVVTAFLLVWINLAVGIVGSETNAANLLFFGVLLVAVVGAGVARLRAAGMVVAMVATAIAQLLVALLVLPSASDAALVLTAVFVGLWLAAAQLFRKAVQQQTV